MAKSKVKKPDAGELMEETPEPVKVKKVKAPAVSVTEQAFLDTLEKLKGEAKLTPLYEAFDKTGYENTGKAQLRKAIYEKGLELAKAGKVEVVHPKPKLSWVFKAI